MSQFPSFGKLFSSVLSAGEAELRRFRRVQRERPASVQARRERAERDCRGVNHGISRDISEGGVQIQAFRQMPVSTDVIVELHHTDAAEHVRTSGSVVWAKPLENGKYWLFGIAFDDMDDETKSKLMRLIDEQAFPLELNAETRAAVEASRA